MTVLFPATGEPFRTGLTFPTGASGGVLGWRRNTFIGKFLLLKGPLNTHPPLLGEFCGILILLLLLLLGEDTVGFIGTGCAFTTVNCSLELARVGATCDADGTGAKAGGEVAILFEEKIFCGERDMTFLCAVDEVVVERTRGVTVVNLLFTSNKRSPLGAVLRGPGGMDHALT